jgi:peptidoglycan/xylan/chitin deacetylase (PgdA/CDA1 family)
MKILTTLLLVLLHSQQLVAKEIAITIDDLPFVWASRFSVDEQKSMFRDTLRTLRKHNVKVVGFTVGASIRSHHRVLLDEFVADGHVIANHTNTHPDFNTHSIEEFKENIVRGQSNISRWAATPSYFRYPMLHRGETEEKRDSIRYFLAKKNFIVAPVSIDNDEWKFARDYTLALQSGNTTEAENVGRRYIDHMKAETLRYDQLANQKMGRKIKHILLLHMNQLNSVYLDELLQWYKDNDWNFISLPDALQDPIYHLSDRYVGTNGISWLERIP